MPASRARQAGFRVVFPPQARGAKRCCVFSWIGFALGGALGAVIGSYLATLALRWPAEAGAASVRSRCDHCGIAIPATQLIPLVSYALLRGRCRACGGSISPVHPALEAGAALIGAIAGGLFAADLPLAAASAVLGWLLLLGATLDARDFWLPDRLTAVIAVAGLAANTLGTGPGLADALIGIAAGFLALWLVARAYRALRGREGLGGGDAKFLAAIGAWLGWAALPWVVFGAALAGLAAALVALARSTEVSAATRLPFGTLLAVAAWPIWIVLAANGFELPAV